MVSVRIQLTKGDKRFDFLRSSLFNFLLQQPRISQSSVFSENTRLSLIVRLFIMRTPNPTSLYCGDCLDVLKDFPSETVDLVYLDPPFFTQKAHSLQTRDRKQTFSFNDIWNSELDYCQFLQERLVETHRVLNRHGALFFHCDRNAAHLVRKLLDHLFGCEHFRSEIIWTYRR